MKRFFWLAILVVCCGYLRAAELYVRLGDYANIQTAINDANQGDTIIVDPCTYRENIDFLGKSITLTSLDPNDPCVIGATIIDGSTPVDINKGSVVTFGSGEGNDSVLTGFTITGGTGTWLVIAWDLHEPYWNRCGGGIVCYNMSQPTIAKNVIIGNAAGEGGGIYVYGNPVDINLPSNPPVHLQPVISYNTIVNNDANEDHSFIPPDSNYTFEENGDGGGIVCFQGVDANVCGNLIQYNHADYYGGAIHFRQWSDGVIKNNLIKNNDSKLGAGIHITYTSSPTISDNNVSDNQASGAGSGGMYVFYRSNPMIERNLVTQNSSTIGAGIGVYYESNPTIRNNLIIANKTGAGIRIGGAAWAHICHNTIIGNTASSIYGGAIECDSTATSTIENNIIARNGQSYGIYVSSGKAIPLVRYNNVWANPAGNYNSVIGDQNGLNGNISLDPCFVDIGHWIDNNTPADFNDDFPVMGDYRIGYFSPCRDTGDSNDITADDFRGKPRPHFAGVDIGAYELQVYDLVTNGIVDYNDIALFCDHWLEEEITMPVDLIVNGIVDFCDFAALAEDFLK